MSSQAPHDLNHTLVETIVRAGAGAGKTRALVQRVSALFDHYQASEQRNPRLVVCTFTRKATQELRERLVREALRTERSGFLDFVQNSSQLHISTIHGVLTLFLRQASHHVGLNPSFEIVSTEKSAAVFRRVIRNSMRQNAGFEDLLDCFSMKQILAYCRQYFELRLMNIEVTVPTAAKCEAIFKERLTGFAEDVAGLIQELEQAGAGDAKWMKYTVELSGLQKFCQYEAWMNLSFEEREDLGFPKRPSFRAGTNPIDDELISRIADAVDELKELQEARWSPDFWEVVQSSHSKLFALARDVFEEIHRIKLTEGLLDYWDLESLSLNVVKNHPELAQGFAEEWDQWLVDEFQDTSPTQVALIEALKGVSPAFYVGDPSRAFTCSEALKSECSRARKIRWASRTAIGPSFFETIARNHNCCRL